MRIKYRSLHAPHGTGSRLQHVADLESLPPRRPLISRYKLNMNYSDRMGNQSRAGLHHDDHF